MAGLGFSVKLKEELVDITGNDGVEKIYKLKELTGNQRAKHNSSYDYKVSITDGVATATVGDNFKMPSAEDFLALCFYDENNKLVSKEVLGEYPSTVLEALHNAALELSGMDVKSIKAAKNELEAKEDSGSE